MLESITTTIFGLGAIVSGILVILSGNPMHSVLALVTTFANTSALMIMMGIDFLGLLFLIVYVGAIAILFLFVVMMLNVKLAEILDNATRYAPLGIIIGILFGLELQFVVGLSPKSNLIPTINHPYQDYAQLVGHGSHSISSLGQVLYTEYWLYLILASLVLLVSLIGAIVLTLRHEEDVKRQDLFAQISR